jgi:hypothetical protein
VKAKVKVTKFFETEIKECVRPTGIVDNIKSSLSTLIAFNCLNPLVRVLTTTHTAMPDVILVTGGHGLVGNAIRTVLETEPPNSRYGRREGETWVFARSGEGDLR